MGCNLFIVVFLYSICFSWCSIIMCNFWPVKMSGWIREKREAMRWKAQLHRRSLFRTSNRERFSQQSAGLQGDGVVISWQWGAGHVGTTRLTSKTADLADCTHTLFVSMWNSKIEDRVGFDFGNLQMHSERNWEFWNWRRFQMRFEGEMSFEEIF